MTGVQRYVSTELTHFVGRHLKKSDNSPDQNAQYDLLKEILDGHRLLHRRDHPDGPARVSFRGDGSFTERTMIELDAVCFCDIPVDDFAIHMKKYSSFGLSFLKSFLVNQGANPAFYVAKNSIIPTSDPAAEVMFPDRPPNPLTRGVLMDRMIKNCMASDQELVAMAFNERVGAGVSAAGIALAKASVLGRMIRSHFISFCVPFDSAKDEAHLENYYMEREWRVIGDVNFRLDDVCRVILPGGHARRFRVDVPEYFGQITFSG